MNTHSSVTVPVASTDIAPSLEIENAIQLDQPATVERYEDGHPIMRAYVAETAKPPRVDIRYVLWCPFCGHVHHHGPGPGQRSAHCEQFVSSRPYLSGELPGSYVLLSGPAISHEEYELMKANAQRVHDERIGEYLRKKKEDQEALEAQWKAEWKELRERKKGAKRVRSQ